MKWLWIVLFPALAWGQLHEILRPTTDIDGGLPIAQAVDPSDCNTAIGNASTAQPNWWDNAGVSTSTTMEQTNTSTSSTRCRSRVFKVWASSTQTYSALTLNVNTSANSTTGLGVGTVSYSLNSGSTWTVIQQATIWTQQTNTIVLSAGQNLSTIWVAGVAFARVNDGSGNDGDEAVTGFDVWTDGTYTPPATPTPVPPSAPAVQQPTVISRMKLPLDLWVIWLSGKLW